MSLATHFGKRFTLKHLSDTMAPMNGANAVCIGITDDTPAHAKVVTKDGQHVTVPFENLEPAAAPPPVAEPPTASPRAAETPPPAPPSRKRKALELPALQI